MSSNSKESKIWDYIVIGTGMGGGPLGLKLAEAGFSVLFLEKGQSPKDPQSLKGQFAEMFLQAATSRNETLKNAGRWTDEIVDCTNGRAKKMEPFIGSGVGGSSAIYGAVLERFRPSDFARWPLSYSEFEEYYVKAEKMFQVQKSSEVEHPGNKKLFQQLQSQGLHPYKLPSATVVQKSCGNCQSFLCSQKCKNDSGKICIDEAVAQFAAELRTECEVQKIEFHQQKVSGVSGVYQGENFFCPGRHVILAAGALQTPVLLQKSEIGDPSGPVGRHLMRHFVDLYALKIDSNPENPKAKEIGFNDFYESEGTTLGAVQSFGRLPPTKVIIDEIERGPFWSSHWILRFLFRMIRPFLALVIQQVAAQRLVMASILEDSPQMENRVWWENGKICVAYQISSEDRQKISLMRKKLKNVFRGLPLLFIKGAEKNKMLAHVCGTCRMGTDPQTSVVDTSNKVHGFDNLYVVDSSFFPTSGGTNPALTIAANSLRVADLLIQKENTKREKKSKVRGGENSAEISSSSGKKGESLCN